MERLTSNKTVQDMGMYELAHNCMFNKDGEAWYRDFDKELSLRDMLRVLYKAYCPEYDEKIEDDEYLDGMLLDDLQIPVDEDFYGLIAVFSMIAWSNADLNERLKHYEDLEEQGKLLELPCKIGDDVYVIYTGMTGKNPIVMSERFDYKMIPYFGKSVFLTKQDALKELERLKRESKEI